MHNTAQPNISSTQPKFQDLDHNLLEYLKEQIETNVFVELERSGFWGGFEIVAEAGVFKVEVLDSDEVDRIACKVSQMNGTTADSSRVLQLRN